MPNDVGGEAHGEDAGEDMNLESFAICAGHMLVIHPQVLFDALMLLTSILTTRGWLMHWLRQTVVTAMPPYSAVRRELWERGRGKGGKVREG